MNPSKIPAPGAYEVVVVIDEEGKARGSKGEQWILIKNQDGAIATVYPAVNAEATARILAAGPELLKKLRLAVAVIEDNKGNLANLDLDEKQMLIGTMKLAIAQATGEPLPVAVGGSLAPLPGRTQPTQPEPENQPEANTKSLFPEELL